MKKLFLAMMAVAACILFNSCESGVQSQVIADWGFESTETPGTIDGNPYLGITFKYTQQAIEEEIESNTNWTTTGPLVSGGQIARIAPTTEKNTKNELTDIFDTAIKKAEDTMKGKGYEAQPKNETVLVIYEFGESTAKTTLKFTVPVYYTPEK